MTQVPDLPNLSSPAAKNFSLFGLVETAVEPIRPAPTKGRFAIVTDVGRDAMDVGARATNDACPTDGEVVWF
jgi:hypothetical protein